jgi:electron transport complex protein RnfG
MEGREKDMPEMHAEKKSGIFRIAINLAITCLIAGVILAAAYFITHPIAVEKAKMLKDLSMQALVPEADTFSPVEGHEDMYEATSNGTVRAYVVSAESKGYGGTISMLVAVTPDGKIIDFNIQTSNETPGLGSKAAEPDFKNQFPGKTSEALIVTKDQANTENIQAMTGATITSKAVTKGVKEAVDMVIAYTGGR